MKTHYERAIELIDALDKDAGEGRVLHGGLKTAIIAHANALDGVQRATTYTCEFCDTASLKELWGPGRITCPTCGKMARTADGTDPNLPREQQDDPISAVVGNLDTRCTFCGLSRHAHQELLHNSGKSFIGTFPEGASSIAKLLRGCEGFV